MRFAEPMFLWGLLTLPLFALLFAYAYHRRKKLAARFVSLSMLPKLSTSVSPWRRLAKVTLLLFAIAFLFVALARPQWGRKMEHIERRGLDLVLLQDISLSMLAEDVKPNRLTRSRHEISSFLESLSGDRVGLVAFSGEAQVMVPLTLDYGTVQMMLRELTPGWLMPGTNLEKAIRKGMDLYRNSGSAGQYSVMILMSDGEELEAAAVNAAKEAAEMGIRIYTIGIGSREGVPIPVPSKNGEIAYKKDLQGNIVTTRLEDGTLQEIASATGGLYFYASPGEFQLQKVLTEIASLEKKEQASDRMENYQDRYQIFLGLAALLFLIEALVSERGRKRRVGAGRFS
ncbi:MULTISPECIES: VWA domain-containing protein [unclassified Fibrobacter]|uniref:vWA domain-containing protein n=1 Tax=unclassified Fibrobacter TaxID=2634177 RepID=UPI00091F3E90|nr:MULTISPECIES: VWA domain-containing protein [unclassified Fibrobacter]MBS7271506.1 VWA domain-containing protein [Fibrobacter sp.]MCI6438605.1 VWA domain-containing protein [Fibrobacter sp.]MDD7497726.1 VWA domain-containing protein [Fibrobacter sp.]MDY5725557.1 VWA domain-containing protein [Fibrobacter sp.]SHK68545.1 Ca-activated chloride channel family protein [Fibrobacter sp. UWH4]